MAGAGEKTEKATPKRRRDERKKGNVMLSRDAVAVVTLFASYAVLRFALPIITGSLSELVNYIISLVETVDTNNVGQVLAELFWRVLITLGKCVALPLLATVLGAVIATFAQTRMLVSFESIKPKFNKLNPLEGIKRLFSLKSFVEALKGFLKVAVLLLIVYQFITNSILIFAQFLSSNLSAALMQMQTMAFDLMFRVGLAFTAIAAFDVLYQWWEYEKNLRMSKEEIKEEYKQTEGDPKVKGKIKENQRKMAQQRMMQAVPGADVVIRNPTHFAIALRYDVKKDFAPVVLAKGQDEVALRIVDMAMASGVSVIENKPLARALYASCEIGSPIPQEHYAAVADVLVYIFKLNKRELT